MLKSYSDFFVERSKAMFLYGLFGCLGFMYALIVLSCLFLAALWSPAGNGLTSWHSSVVFSCLSQLCLDPHQN